MLKDVSGIVRFFKNCNMSCVWPVLKGLVHMDKCYHERFEEDNMFIIKLDYAIYAIILQLHISKIFLTVLAYLHPNSLSKTCANAEH